MVVLTIMLVPAVGSAGGGGGSSSCDGFDTGDTITMLDSCFAGTAHFASTGQEIVVENHGILPHSFTAVDGKFDSGTVQPGGSFVLQVDEIGTYQVFCTLHGTATGQGMAGVLIVDPAETATNLASGQPPATRKQSSLTPGIALILAIGGAGVLVLPISRSIRRRQALTIEHSADEV